MQNIINYKSQEITEKLKQYINCQKNNKDFLNIVILCIGTDRMTGDSFGPLVGSLLEEKLEKSNICNINIYGTLEKNVCYTNIHEILNLIEDRHPSSCVIVIDSALSNKENIGKVIVSNEEMHIGKGLNKKKIEIGNISIKAIVGKNTKIPKYNFYTLQTVSLNEVIKLSRIVSNCIINAIEL